MIVKHKEDEFLSYLEDTSNLRGNADILYIPETQAEASYILETCQKKQTPVTFLGGRTGTVGGCVSYEGAILSLEKLNRIIDIDAKRKTVIVEAGATLETLEAELRKFDLSLRAQPTESLAYVGGSVSTSASGMRGFKYGGIRRYVRRIKVILVDGRVLDIGRSKFFASGRRFSFYIGNRHYQFSLPSYHMPLVKHQAGYFVKDNMDLIDLFIGSEGTLGLISEVELSLQSLANKIFDCIVFFKREGQALEFVKKVKEAAEAKALEPTSLEFFDKNSLDFLRTVYPHLESYEGAVYFEQEIDHQDNFDKVIDIWLNIIETTGATQDDTWFGDTEAERKKIYNFRHKLPQLINEFLKKHNQTKVATDIAVPEEKFFLMYNYYKEVGEDSGIFYVNFGHIGENHLHFNFLPKNEEDHIKAKFYATQFIKKAVSLGGTVSAEHGIGKIKKSYLEILYGSKGIKEMAFLKKYFDLDYLLGRDNIFNKDVLIS